jgi:hypothetical protein
MVMLFDNLSHREDKMKAIGVAVIAFGLTVFSIGGFYSVALATHGGDHCTLEEHMALIAKGYNNKQEAAICDGRSPQDRDSQTEGDIIIRGLLGESRQPRATFCQTQYGHCALNGGSEGEGCSCRRPDGQQDRGFVRGAY